MAALQTDFFTEVGNPGTATTLAAPGHAIAGTSITVVSTSNWPTTTGAIFAIDTFTTVNGVEVRDVGSYTEWEGIVASSTSITNMVLRYGTDQVYPSGVNTRVYIPVASSRENRFSQGMRVDHNQAGGHTFTQVLDVNGNESLKLGTTTSAVNEITITNAATGSGPTISSTGGDTNTDINLTPKGTGQVKINGNPIGSGAWGTWTPTWTNLTIGNATVSGRYTQIGKTIIYTLDMVWGSTTSGGASQVIASLPVTAQSLRGTSATVPYGSTFFYDLSATTTYTGEARQISTTTIAFTAGLATGTYVNQGSSAFISTQPFTWATGDEMHVTGSYEAA